MDNQERGAKWDNCQKAYASATAPLILGCVGNGFYAAHIAPRVIAYAELLLQSEEDIDNFLLRVKEFSASALRSAPGGKEAYFEIILGIRTDLAEFKAIVLRVSKLGAKIEDLPLPQKSGLVYASGSGAEFVRDRLAKWQETKASDTSRAIYSGFCDALLYENPNTRNLARGRSKDPFSEGPPQLVGLYRKWSGRHYGIVWRKRLYFCGIQVSGLPQPIECRNDLFERCDPTTMRRMDTAKRRVDEVAAAKRNRDL